MSDLYYTAPSDEAFEDMKQACIKVWNEAASHPSYLEEKVNRIKDIVNVQDNFMYMLAMFDIGNQQKVSFLLKEETKQAVHKRLVAGGSPEFIINQMGF